MFTHTRIPVRLTLLAVCIITAGLQGCGNSSSQNPLQQSAAGEGTPTSPLAPQQIANQAAIALVNSDAGSTVTVTDSASPIAGAGVALSKNALPQVQEIIQIGYEDQLPAPLPEGLTAVQASKVLVLERSNPTDLSYPADISLPYDKSKLTDADIPQLLYFDPNAKTYTPVTISAMDPSAGVVHFRSAHFSRYVLIAVTPPDSLPAADSGFRPDVDGFFIRKTSDPQTSYAMASYAVWYSGKKAAVGHDLYSAYREGDPAIEDDDLAVRELVGRLLMHSDSALLQENYSNGVARQSQVTVGKSLIAAMQVSNKPQILLMGDGQSVRKAVVVYAYDAANARFLVYDTDFPGEVVYLPFGAAGFGHYTKDINNDLTVVTQDDAGRSYSVDYFESALNGVESGWGESGPVQSAVAAVQSFAAGVMRTNAATPAVAVTSYPKIHITQPLTNVKNPLYYDIASEDNVVISGTVDPDPKSTAPRYLHVYVDGVSFNGGSGDNNWHTGTNPVYKPISIDAQGNFQFTIPKVPNASGTNVTMLVSYSATYAGSVQSYIQGRESASSFKAIRLKVPGTDFFNNLNFEQGDFSSWLSELRHWFNGVLGNPSPDSAIVGSGLDPIANASRSPDANNPAPNLNMVLFGKHAARINDSASGYHISRIAQESMVPSTGNPVIHFNWAAVLENPAGHTASEQPYVDIKITDLTDGKVLKQYHFYAYDPLYTGWQTYSATQDAPWQAIPWQTVDFPVKAYAGHTLQLQVEAADCAQGGHGGYVYVDAE